MLRLLASLMVISGLCWGQESGGQAPPVPAAAGSQAANPNKGPELSPKQALKLLKSFAERNEAFLDSKEAKKETATLGRFLTHKEYLGMTGNPVLGYYQRRDFRWAGDKVAIDFKSVGPDKGALCISPRAWEIAFGLAARTHGIRIDKNAPVRVVGACVLAVIEPDSESPRAGVLCELKAVSPKGVFYYRFNLGKDEGIEAAVACAAEWMLVVLREQGKGTSETASVAVPRKADLQAKGGK